MLASPKNETASPAFHNGPPDPKSFWRRKRNPLVCSELTLVLSRAPPVSGSPLGLEFGLCQDSVGSQFTRPLIPLLPPGSLMAVSWPAVLTHCRSVVTGKGAAGAMCKPHPGLVMISSVGYCFIISSIPVVELTVMALIMTMLILKMREFAEMHLEL